ncbi:MAG: alpha/beta fold hydrolase [Ktedonobacteraceae bacterium]
MHVPTLVIRGSIDAITPQRWAEEVTKLLPKGRLVVIEGAYHDVQDGAPEELAREIYTFLIKQLPEE